jgi:hypothetical protein
MKHRSLPPIFREARSKFARFVGLTWADGSLPLSRPRAGGMSGPAPLRLAVLSVAFALVSGCIVERPRARVYYTEPPPVVVTQAPPAPLSEQVPVAPGPDFVWIAGHWHWNGNRWVWNRGYFARPPRRGAVWVAPRFEAHEGGSLFIGGYWR